MPAIDFAAAAAALNDTLIARRRDFHQHPELAFQEVRTAGIVAQTLTELGLEVQAGVGKTGVVAILEGAQDGPTVLVRADMDALPIQEDTGSPFASQTASHMHACGHDGHTSIALAVAEMLTAHRDKLAGRVKFVFQPAEEIGRGAQAMVDDGVLSGPRPDVSVGLHLWNSMPVGTLGLADGAVMAGASVFRLTVRGKGSHAASPHQGLDPVVCAAHMITAFQSIVSRSVDPLDTLVISVTKMHAGDAYNVIPQAAELAGTVRAYSKAARDLAFERMAVIANGCAAAFGCTAELSYDHLTVPVVNHPTTAARLRGQFQSAPGVKAIDTTVRTMGSEDVSLFMDDIPGVFFFVGAMDETQAEYYGHHHPRFSIDERSLALGAQLLATAAAGYLLNEG